MDKMGREGGGGPRYVMPRFEDNSTFGPGDEFYEYVRSAFSIDEWNAMPDEARGQILDQWYSGPETTSSLGHIPEKFAGGRIMQGLFGGGEEGPLNPPATPQSLPTPSQDGTPTSALIGEFMRGRR